MRCHCVRNFDFAFSLMQGLKNDAQGRAHDDEILTSRQAAMQDKKHFKHARRLELARREWWEYVALRMEKAERYSSFSADARYAQRMQRTNKMKAGSDEK